MERRNQALRHVLEGPILEEWGTRVDRSEPLRDAYGVARQRYSLPENRQNGDFVPHFRTEIELQRIRGAAQWIATTHPMAVGLIDDLCNYTISTGFDYTVDHKDQSILSDQQMTQVDEVINEFAERVDNQTSECSFERELFKRSIESGEFFANVEDLEAGGFADLRVCEPEWIMEPMESGRVSNHYGLDDGLNWKYGIATERARPTRIHGYFAHWDGDKDFANVHIPDEMIHGKFNVPSTVKRGLSDFYYLDHYLEDHSKLVRHTVRGATIQSSIALVREHQSGMHGADVEKLVASQTDQTINTPTIGGSGSVRQRRIREYLEGTVLDVTGSKYHPGPLGSPNGPTYVEIAQAVIRMVAARWSMPEHMISNAISGAGGARAALVEVGTPFARRTITRQEMYRKLFEQIMWRVVKIATFYGRIDAGFEDVKRSVKLKVGVPEATQRNEAEQHLVYAGRHQAGLMSKRTWSEKVNLDYETEQERLQDDLSQQVEQQMIGQQVDQMGANSEAEGLQKQREGKPGEGEVGRQQSQGAGADSLRQDRSLGVRNAKQSIKQKLAAGRAGKQVQPI